MRHVLIFLLIFILSCNTTNKSDYSIVQKSKTAQKNTGKMLMETNCYSCHNPKTPHNERIAPPMIAIKKHYITDSTTKNEFIAALKTWIKNPNKNDAKMFGAVRRFGVMPKQHVAEDTIAQIAAYIYDNDIDEPEWFQNHMNENKDHDKAKNKTH